MKNIVFLFVLVFAGCSSAESDSVTTVTGVALNAKAGAIVAVGHVDEYNSGIPYYIDGLREWDKELYGKTVTVTGTLTKIYHEPPQNGEIRQQITGNQLIIKKSKWKIVK